MSLIFKSSPFKLRDGGLFQKPISCIVVHATAGASAVSSIQWMRDKDLSYHYIIERDGTVFTCAPRTNRAFHAGLCSNAPLGGFPNSYAIGIAFANKNDGIEKITEEQEKALALLVQELKRKITTLKTITTHRAIAPKRKTDPINWELPQDEGGKYLGLEIWR